MGSAINGSKNAVDILLEKINKELGEKVECYIPFERSWTAKQIVMEEETNDEVKIHTNDDSEHEKEEKQQRETLVKRIFLIRSRTGCKIKTSVAKNNKIMKQI